MEWLNLHKSTLDSKEVRTADSVDRGAWLLLLAYCIGQENGGIIESCSHWTDKMWLSVVGITSDEAQRRTHLWSWNGSNLHVAFYPLLKERQVRNNREAARIGGSSNSEAKKLASRLNGSKGGRKPKRNPSKNPTEGEGKGKDKGIEGNGSIVGFSQLSPISKPVADAEGGLEGHIPPNLGESSEAYASRLFRGY